MAYVRDEKIFVKTGQLEAAAMSINSIFQQEDHEEFTSALNESIETAQKLLNKIRGIVFDGEPIISLQTLKDYDNLHECIENFFIKKTTEYRKAEYPTWDSYSCSPGGRFKSFEIGDDYISLIFEYCYDISPDHYRLPIDILFDGDFYKKMKARFDEKRLKENEQEKERELKLLDELKKKYEK